MSKAVSYVSVGVMAFFCGGFSFLIIGNAGAAAKQADVRQFDKGATAREFVIEGMSCQGCAGTITATLTKIPDVESAKVSLEEKRAVVVANASQVPTEKILAAIAAAGYKGQLVSAGQDISACAAAFGKQPILVNITRGKNELHAVSMALGLAQSAIKDGRPASIFLNVEAPVFAAKDLDNQLQYSDFPPIKKLLADFLATGGRMMVCRHCASVANLKQEDMIDGVKVLDHQELFSSMTPGTVVFSY
jgi:predicted peroxiredoxin/copper chaperone CopZ